ncbi:MAG: protein kinase domain-containing protein, partial [Rudaea sp.]
HGVVHRDLKPANIMFRDTGTPVLTDFGIARMQDGAAMRLTQTGMLVGTPTYMSPEQINGLQVDGRADQYSLGILFRELLTGAPPFRADTSIGVLMAHLSQPLPPLPAEFHAFEDVIARMLAKNRDERYPNLREFCDDLKSRLVHSDTLLMRLQVDPNQPSSEQLRALGFSTSVPGTPPRAPTPAPALLSSTPAPIPARAAAPVARKRSFLVAVVGVAVALALVVGGWMIWGERSTLTQDERELVSLWLDRAQQRIEANQSLQASAGTDGSAVDYLQKVLQKDPGNSKAERMLDRITLQAGAQGEAAIARGNLGNALTTVNLGLQIRPRNGKLLALKAHLEQLQKAAAPAAKGQAATPATVPSVAAPAPATPPSAAPAHDAGAAAAKTPTPANTAPNVPPAPPPAAATPTSAAASPTPVAERGELLLNAQPWANVESILDEQLQAVKLPADASTPFALLLPVGKYVIIFRNPLAEKPVQVVAVIEANKRTRANAVFATSRPATANAGPILPKPPAALVRARQDYLAGRYAAAARIDPAALADPSAKFHAYLIRSASRFMLASTGGDTSLIVAARADARAALALDANAPPDATTFPPRFLTFYAETR